jgi:hypothetical protein
LALIERQGFFFENLACKVSFVMPVEACRIEAAGFALQKYFDFVICSSSDGLLFAFYCQLSTAHCSSMADHLPTANCVLLCDGGPTAYSSAIADPLLTFY